MSDVSVDHGVSQCSLLYVVCGAFVTVGMNKCSLSSEVETYLSYVWAIQIKMRIDFAHLILYKICLHIILGLYMSYFWSVADFALWRISRIGAILAQGSLYQTVGKRGSSLKFIVTSLSDIFFLFSEKNCPKQFLPCLDVFSSDLVSFMA